MANLWFRLYSEFADDPKVQMMTEAMQRRLVMLMCLRCKEETLHETQMAFHWRIGVGEVRETKAIFIENGFIDEDWNLVNWNKRQFLSDSSYERVRKHRQAKKQGETLQTQNVTTDIDAPIVTVTAPEQNRTDTQAEQKQRQKEIAAEAKNLAVAAAKETAARAKALALTSGEVPASVVVELPLSANLVLPGTTDGDNGEGPAVEPQSGDGISREPNPVDEGATRPSLFPRRSGEQVLPRTRRSPRILGPVR